MNAVTSRIETADAVEELGLAESRVLVELDPAVLAALEAVEELVPAESVVLAALGAVAWAWGLNGLFTVIGSLGSVLLGLAIGFQATILVAMAIYAAAFIAFASRWPSVAGLDPISRCRVVTRRSCAD